MMEDSKSKDNIDVEIIESSIQFTLQLSWTTSDCRGGTGQEMSSDKSLSSQIINRCQFIY